MSVRKIIPVLVILIILLAALATLGGILSKQGPGKFEYTSIRGEKIMIYGKGIYQHMSADVAIQGIAQDYITLFGGIPLLIIGLMLTLRKSRKGKLILSGTVMYFLVTYLFYTAMGMYNVLFLVYVTLLCVSFFAFVLMLCGEYHRDLRENIGPDKLLRYAGLFLMINSFLVALLWLSSILPPLFDGSIYPAGLQHYTTLIVQGFDLGLLLPAGIVSGWLAIKKNRTGYMLTSVYLVFLSILMAALTSKILFMAKAGYNVIPVIFIMPTICVLSIIFSLLIFKNIKDNS